MSTAFNSYCNRCAEAFSPFIPNLHPAEVMKRLDRGMYAFGAAAILFGALLVLRVVLGDSGIMEGVILSAMAASGGMAAFSYFQRLKYSNAIKQTSIDLNGFETRYRFADIKKDFGVLFLGKRAIVPIMVPIPETPSQDETIHS